MMNPGHVVEMFIKLKIYTEIIVVICLFGRMPVTKPSPLDILCPT